MKRLHNSLQKATNRSRTSHKVIRQAINTITRLISNPDLSIEEKSNLQILLQRADTTQFLRAARKAQHAVRVQRQIVQDYLESQSEESQPA